MKISIKKENFLNAIKAVRGIVLARGVQPILSSILIEAEEDNKIKLVTTDLNLSMIFKADAVVEKKGKIAVSARFLEEIITKLPDEKDIFVEFNEETSTIKIQSEKTKYEVVTLNADEFPDVFNTTKKTSDDDAAEYNFEISTKELNRAIKQTVFSAVQGETSSSVLSGICFTISDNILEMVATDGNRLTRSRVGINSKGANTQFICSYKALVELSKMMAYVSDKELKFTVKGSKIVFEFENIVFQSSLIDGTYPKYQQLVPTNNEKVAIINRDKFINTIDRISVMVNNRTNIMKFNFEEDSLEISTNTPEAGSAKERTDIEYKGENLLIGFNYKYVLDCVRSMTNTNIKIEMATNLSAAVIKPVITEKDVSEDSYLCLIMPVRVE